MKQYERLMRGAHDGRTREIPREIYELAAEYGIHDQGQAAELYNRARRHAPPDSPEIGYEFRRLLKESQPSRKRIAPTKRTLTAALYGDPNRWAAPKPGVGPGKRTRTQTLKEELAKRKRYLEMRAYFAEAERTGTPIPNEVKFPHYREVMGLVAASKERLADREHQGRRRTSLPPEVQRNMEHAFGLGFGDVEVYTDSDKASGSKHAVTEGREIHFAPGKYAPGTQEGDWLIGHELAHVVQQRGDVASGDSSGDSSGDPSAGNRASAEHAALETEADRAADAAAAGRQAQVQLQARYGQAQAFDGSESRGEESFASGASADAVESREADGGHESESPDASSDENIDENIDVQAEIAAIASEGVGGESAEVPAGGGGSGGGADAGEPAPTAAPAVAQAQPEQALQQLAQSSARPEQIAATLGGVQSSASNSVAQERQALAQAPPQIPVSLPPARAGEQTGEGQGAASSDAGPGAQGGEGANGQAVPRATGEQAGSTMEAQAAPEHAPGGATARGDAASNMTEADAGSPAQAPSVQAAGADIAAMSQTVQAASSATGMDTGVGPAPKVALTGGADPEKVQQNHAALEQKAGAVKANALRELAAPMGEDQIATELTTETFAMPTAGDGAGGGAEAQGPVLKGNAKLDLSARGEAVGIIAAREKGADIQAAMAQAAADMADKRQAHARDEAAMRDELAQDIDGLKAEAAAGQAQARQEAQAQVSEARGAWQAQVEETSAAAKTQADAALRQGMDSINAEKQRADSEAGRHVAEGQAKAESERKQAESEVAAHKQDAKSQEESGGIWGWVKSRAKAFFDGIKQAISAAMEAARAAIKRAIETATKLATAVIDKARQAITAAIQLVGKALTAIADTLLAAFPELRDKFRAKIAGLVAKATAAVNKWADKLKAGVKKGLELLGQGLDAGLRLLERGLHAAVDGVAFVVDGALSAAEAVAQTLGGFLALVKDVAAGPGQWLSKLGAAVMDGIKNHLWPAFKTAVSEWFQSKVVELLGIGGMVLQILAQGGIDLRQIGKMAWDALKAAIPAALIAILVQKLVSMIVPAAGAVMVIIEGLQAAWGTIQRIVAAMGAFMAFLRAVKGGSAGPQFAQMLALAVVVVLDFVANWLLKKLRRAAAKVGSKLKALAKRLAGRFKGKTRGNRANRKAAKKDGERDKDKGRAQKAAKKGAADGWKRAKSATGKRAMSQEAAEQSLQRARGNKGGVRVNVDAAVQGKAWSVKATATVKGKSATATKGRGSVLRNKSGGTFMASVDIQPVEQRVEAMTRKELGKSSSQSVKSSDLTSHLQRVESRGRKMLDAKLKGLTLRLDKAPGKGRDASNTVKALIEPNYHEWNVGIFGGYLEQVAKDVQARGIAGRYDEQLAFLEGLSDKHKVKVSFIPGPKENGFPEFISAIFEDGGEKLEVWCHRLDSTNIDKGALSDRPLTPGMDTSKLHDALSAADWRQGFAAAAASLGVATGDGGFKRVRAFFTGTSGMAIGDGDSEQPFDSKVHGEDNALKRHRDTAGMGSNDEHATYAEPSIGRVTVSEYRGKNFDKLDEPDVKRAMRARAKIATSYALAQVEAKFGTDRGFTNLMQSGGIVTKARALQLIRSVETWIINNKCS